MTFSHFANAPIDELSPVKYKQNVGVHQKPVGLWLSVDGEYDWAWWCEQESFGIGAFRHAVSLRPDANLLVLSTVEQLDAFTHRYLTSILGSMAIDWPRVAQEYSGIVIAPYQWKRRCGWFGPYSWYYSWDCASACVWDLYTISEWSPLPRWVCPRGGWVRMAAKQKKS